MNDVFFPLDVFKIIKIFYSDTHSIYIHKADFKILEKQRMIGEELGQSKNDYGNSSGIVYFLFSAPRIK